MSQRINLAMLEKRIHYLNDMVGKEMFQLSQQDGKYGLRSENGGRDALNCGHISKRELFDLILAMQAGIRLQIEIHKSNEELKVKIGLRKEILGEGNE